MKNRSCCFATTKYQTFNAINIAYNSEGIFDLYIIDELYKDTDEFANRIRKEMIFENVFVIKVSEICRYSDNKKLNHLFGYLHHRKIAHKVLNNHEYENMYFCTGSLIEEITRWELMKKGTRVTMYDEGVASYLGIMEHISKIDYFCRALLIGKVSLRFEFDKLLYRPGLYIGKDGTSRIDTLPSVQKGSEQSICINRIFGYHSRAAMVQKVLLFDFVPELILNEEGCMLYATIVHTIGRLFGNDLLIKPHPADKKNREYISSVYESTSIPFEVINLNDNFTNRVIVTFFSSAAISPKMLYDEEPTVVILYKIFLDYLKVPIADELQLFFAKTVVEYREKKFFIPETYEECLLILERITKSENNG